MKQALAIVSFGTSVPAAEQDLVNVEYALASAMPEAECFRALTSPTIRKKLQSRGREVYSLEELLQKLAAQGYDRVIIQPTHLLYGIEYDKIKATVQKFAPRFESLLLGKPLLADTEDLIALAMCMKEKHASQTEALVLMGHGTEHFANMVYPAFQTVLRLQNCPNVYVGTVEGWPGIEDVIAQLKADGVSKVNLVPMMLVAGDHAINDMAGSSPDSWKSRLEAAGIAVRCHMEGLGRLPQIQALYCSHLQELL